MPDAPKIRRLDDHVINQIAAGEVVERPVSIVKELLENAIDADASRVDIDIERGGIERIQVRDDGVGIARDELHLALERHCTSKLTLSEELAAIASLGFRGEALASIASVAELSIVSRTADDEHGWKLAPAASGPVIAAHSRGTTVDVRALFGRVPARRRFLKQARTEYLHVYQLVRHVAFCYPDVAFRLTSDGRETLRVAAAGDPVGLQKRLRAIFGREFAEQAIAVKTESDGVQISGWVGPPAIAKPRADLQFVAVNRRVVRDRSLNHALRAAYSERIIDGRYPCYALDLRVPPDEVDVNVHPNKTEVRLHQQRLVHDLLYSAVHRALNQQPEVREPDWLALQQRQTTGARLASPAAQYRTPRRPSRQPPPAAERALDLIGVIAGRFALIETETLPRIIDVAALIEKLSCSRLGGACNARPLIVPETLVRAPAATLRDKRDAIADFGIELIEDASGAWRLCSVPLVLPPMNYAEFVDALGEELDVCRDVRDAISRAAARAFVVPAAPGGQERWLSDLLQLADAHGVENNLFERERGLEDWVRFLRD